MSVVDQNPLNPSIAQSAGTISPGLASAFRPALNALVGAVENKAELVQAHLEQMLFGLGMGALSGGTITGGVGLSVVISPLRAMVGNIVETDSASTVGGLAANATNFLWLRQDGWWSAGTTTTAPGPADGHGTAFLWGTATTNASTVTFISNVRDWFQRWSGETVVSLGTVANGTVIITDEQAVYPTIRFAGTVLGTVSCQMPPMRGAKWIIHNAGTPVVRLCVIGYGGGSVDIGSLKHAVVRSDGTSIRRVTADI